MNIEVKEVQIATTDGSEMSKDTVMVPSFSMFQELKQKVKHLEEALEALHDAFALYTDHRATINTNNPIGFVNTKETHRNV